MSPEPKIDYSNDQPLVDPNSDRLNRAPFAAQVASVLRELPSGASLVIGIHGPWGDGKTTVLNLIRSILESDEKIVVRDFNPWRLTDDEKMFRGFFSTLAGAIGVSLSTAVERAKAKTAKHFAWLGPLARAVGHFSKTAETISKVLDGFKDAVAAGNSVKIEELRGRLIPELAKSPVRIVVLVDDLDRLDKDETHTLFRLIKACADFPNVCYVLAFDDIAVAKALGERYGEGNEKAGRAFLEKIIQVPLKLPLAAKEDLRELCLEQVERALGVAKIELTQRQISEFVSAFDQGASVRLTTPRAAKRFGNSLMFVLPMVAGETNVVDLLLVESLRAFFPEIYDIVRDNHTAFSGTEPERQQRGNVESRLSALLSKTLSEMPEEQSEAAKALLITLFPRVASALGGGHIVHGGDALARWNREKRISSPTYCARYFMLSVGRNDVSETSIREILDAAATQDQPVVDEKLARVLRPKRARRFIERLRSSEKEIDPHAVESLAIGIVKLGEQLPNPTVMFDVAEAPTQTAILISHLLRLVADRRRRVEIAKRIVDEAQPLWLGAECLHWMRVTDKPEKEDSNALTSQELEEVRKSLVVRIKAKAFTGASLFDQDNTKEIGLLQEWRIAEGREAVQAHLLSIFAKDPSQIPIFLGAFAGRAWGIGELIPHASDLDATSVKGIKSMVDLDILAGLIRQHCSGNFDSPEWYHDDSKPLAQRLPEQFMYVYNKWKAEGEPRDKDTDTDTNTDPDDETDT